MTSGPEWAPWPRASPELLAGYVSHRAAASAVPPELLRLSARDDGPFRTVHDLRAQGRIAEVAAALYDGLCGLGIEYEWEPVPGDATELRQQIRTPAQVVRDGRATCLDLALLFAGLCIEARLLPTVVLLQDAAATVRHALVVVDGRYTADDYDLPRGWPEEARTRGWWSGDAARCELLARIDAQEHASLAVECTGFARTLADGRAQPTLSFAQACEAGRRRLAEMELDAAVDVVRLQRGKGYPVAVPAADDGGTPRERLARRYPQLADDVYDFSDKIAAETDGFVGRGWVLDELERFRATWPAGYFCVTADAGLGKTVLAAEIARRHASAAFFFSISEGYTSPERCLRHLCAELIGRFSLPHPHLPERAGHDWNFLTTVLKEAREKSGAPVLLVIDALDEASDAAGALLFPNRLPAGAHVVLTSRTAIPIASGGDTHPHHLRIQADDPRHRADILDFLRLRATRASWGALVRGGPEKFVQRLSEASEGNFMYLRFVLADLTAAGADPESFSTGALPHGLNGYYHQFWRGIEAAHDRDGWTEWDRLYRPSIAFLTAALEPVTPGWLAGFVDAPPEEIEERALARWARFLRRHPGEGRWRIVHQSFADFVARERKVDLRAAHARIAARALAAWGGVEQGLPHLSAEHAADPGHAYGWRHAVRHLRLAGEHDTLAALVEHPRWYEARMQHDPSGALFQADLEQAWAAAEERSRDRIARGQAPEAALELRRALQVASVNSLSHNLSPELLAALVECGHWTARTAVAAARMNPDGAARSNAVEALAPFQDLPLVQETLQAAPAIPLGKDAVGALLARLCVIGKGETALDEVLSPRRDSEAQAELLATVAGVLPPPLLARAADAAMALDAHSRPISSPDPRGRGLQEVARHAPADLLPRLWDYVASRDPDQPRHRLRNVLALRQAQLGDWRGAWKRISREIPLNGRAVSLGELLQYIPADEPHARRDIAEQGAALLPDTFIMARPDAAAALAPELEPEHALRVVREVLSQAQNSLWDESVARLAPGLPLEAIGEALELAVHHDGYQREQAVTALARRLVQLGRVQEAVAAARRAGDSYRFGDVIVAILPDVARLGHVEQAVSLAVGLDDLARPDHLPGGLVAVARHVDPPWLDRLRERAAAIPHLPDRRTALLGIAPRYARLGMPQEALRLARSISDDRDRPALFGAFALAWMGSLADPRRALSAALAIPDNATRLRVLEELAGGLPGPLLRRGISWLTWDGREDASDDDAVESIPRGRTLAPFLSALARLGPREAEEAWATAEKWFPSGRYRCIAAVAPLLPEPARSQRLAAAVEEIIAGWDGDWRQAVYLGALVPSLTEEPLRRLTLHLEVNPPRQPESLIGSVAARWCELGRMTEGLLVAEMEPEGYFWGRIVAGTVPFMDADTVRGYLDAARSREQPQSSREELVPALLARLVELGFAGEAVEVATTLHEREVRNAAIARLAGAASPELLARLHRAVRRLPPDAIDTHGERALAAIAARYGELGDADAALRIGGEVAFYAEADVLAGAAPAAEGAVLDQALERAQKLSLQQATALAPLLRRLAETRGGDGLRRALRIACDVSRGDDRPDVLSALVPALTAAPVPDLHPLWSEALHTLARNTRRELIADLVVLVPVLARLGGADALESATASLRDVALRWP